MPTAAHGPRGHGEAVVLVPGFLGDDRYLTEMHLWLRRIGYKPYFSGIGRNVDCPDLLTQRLVMTIHQAYEDTNQPVSIVGHSLGGMLARAAGHREPALVRQVITMGSPFRSVRAHPLVLSAANFVRSNIVRERKHRKEVTSSCFTPECSAVGSVGSLVIESTAGKRTVENSISGQLSKEYSR